MAENYDTITKPRPDKNHGLKKLTKCELFAWVMTPQNDDERFYLHSKSKLPHFEKFRQGANYFFRG